MAPAKAPFSSSSGKTVLDLGCGYGWHCAFAAQQGAVRILGIDLSGKMIEEAKKNNDGSTVSFEELLKKEGLTYADL